MLASFCYPHYFSRASPVSTHCTWNSRKLIVISIWITHFTSEKQISKISFWRLCEVWIEEFDLNNSSNFDENVYTRGRKRPSWANERERRETLRRCPVGRWYGSAYASRACGSALGRSCGICHKLVCLQKSTVVNFWPKQAPIHQFPSKSTPIFVSPFLPLPLPNCTRVATVTWFRISKIPASLYTKTNKNKKWFFCQARYQFGSSAFAAGRPKACFWESRQMWPATNKRKRKKIMFDTSPSDPLSWWRADWSGRWHVFENLDKWGWWPIFFWPPVLLLISPTITCRNIAAARALGRREYLEQERTRAWLKNRPRGPLVICNKINGVIWRFARLVSRTQVEFQLKPCPALSTLFWPPIVHSCFPSLPATPAQPSHFERGPDRLQAKMSQSHSGFWDWTIAKCPYSTEHVGIP